MADERTQDAEPPPRTRSQRYAILAVPTFALYTALAAQKMLFGPDANDYGLSVPAVLSGVIMLLGLFWTFGGEKSDEREDQITKQSMAIGLMVALTANLATWLATRPGRIGENWDAGAAALVTVNLTLTAWHVSVLIYSKRGV